MTSPRCMARKRPSGPSRWRRPAATTSRSAGPVPSPPRFRLVAATIPGPGGWSGDGVGPCRCTPGAVDTYRRRLSGPLLDRIDLQVSVRRVPLEALTAEPRGEPSAVIRERVMTARARQLARQGCLNAQLKPARLRLLATLPAVRSEEHTSELQS